MYTRCPSCSSTFRVTAAVLQMAEGEVRCGACGVVFNALHTLVDDWSGAGFTLPGAPQLSHPESPAARAGEPEPPRAEPPQAADVPVDDTLEFDVPENEWQRFFITPQAPAAADRREPGLGEDFDGLDEPAMADDAVPAVAAEPAMAPEPAGEDPGDEEPGPGLSLEEETADTDTWKAFLQEAEGRQQDLHGSTAGDEAVPEDDPEGERDDEPLFVMSDDGGRSDEVHVIVRRQPDAPRAAPPPAGGDEAQFTLAATPEVGDAAHVDAADEAAGARQVEPSLEIGIEADLAQLADEPARESAAPAVSTVLDWGPPPVFPERAPREPTHAGRWFAASLLAALALAGQFVHYARDSLAADPGYGGLIRDAYSRLGLPLDPWWPLDAYEIRGAKAIAENTAPGALDIVAEIAVTGSQPVGLPMVRVVLRDRWSNAVASGVFDPTKYLAGPAPPSRVYAPGTLIPVQISLQDPGSAAQGYELDICIPNRKLGLQCKAARDPFRR